MTIYKEARKDGITGQVEYIEYSSEEWKVYQENQAVITAEREAQKLEQEAREAAKQSALDKLAALGLTPAEISAITGA